MSFLRTASLALFLALFFALLASPTSATPMGNARHVRNDVAYSTNGERLSRGLSPLVPRKLYAPSASDGAPAARRSPAPPGRRFTCTNYAECCSSVNSGEGTGTGCDNNMSNTNTCSAGKQGICCNNRVPGQDRASGCHDPTS
ncbi:hypothetical protein CALCODRAFT_491177 [Calocera cornea HHB12733]|uniref:Hydrophobin n=1 Tax=Calocera cornea HHB12733 TaxID=1353952 RepID=A0A165J4Y0_9BASI|nr:hypothetical protein CALCODRAFT_491177 [Calocera cornea HHB12733]